MLTEDTGVAVFLSKQIIFGYLLFIFGLATVFLYRRWRQYERLKHFKGPFGTGVSWIWHSWAAISGDAHLHYGDVTDKYGLIVRVAPNHLITSSPSLWTRINAARSPYKRSPWFYHGARVEDGKDNVFTECDNDKHDARRKKMAAGYAGKENPTLEPTIDEQIKNLIHLIRSKYAAPSSATKPSKPMDLSTKIDYLTLDVISALALGKAFGDLTSDSDINDYLASCHTGLYLGNLSWALGTGWLLKLPILGPLLSPSEKDVKGFGKMISSARAMISARASKPIDERSDMLSSFIRHGITGDDLFQEAFETILAGSDTTSAAMRIILLYIMTHPRVYNKLRSEIDSVVKAENTSSSTTGIIPDIACRRMPYLSAVIREGMRIHPPVTDIFSRIVPPEGDTVTLEDGKSYFLPGGTLIGYSAWSMHRSNTSIYGSDAHVFRPERWLLSPDDPKLVQMQKTNDLIFGYGRWQCLGKTVALIEIHKLVFELLRRFDWAVSRPEKPWSIFNSLGLFAISEFWVDVTVREGVE